MARAGGANRSEAEVWQIEMRPCPIKVNAGGQASLDLVNKNEGLAEATLVKVKVSLARPG